ncbi:MerR family transcriptional regulator [Falsirhodobacter sp. alg1]|uniref:MerR family transcriptional regulator n=1 Tax=Falsirhodobacter sp. alg1 TaxID=1472418 RepID=UPI0009E91CBD|nr:MerR family transcriptional regulator [Falsirhodobacter sp. alg1]
MDKSADAFRTISEVADILQTPAHVLRFWESRFLQIKPVKRAGGRRYYRPSDVALLSGIRRLLHEDGMTIRGVQKILKEQGVRHVAEHGRREEAGYIELEPEDEVHTAEVHAFPRRPATHVDPALVGWTFTPSTDDAPSDAEFFAATPTDIDTTADEAPPPPLGVQDANLARLRAERLKEPAPQAETPALLTRLQQIDPAQIDPEMLRPLVLQLVELRQRMNS